MAARVAAATGRVPVECGEPSCDQRATFGVWHGVTGYGFCEAHVWERVQHWLLKLPVGESIVVRSLTLPEPQLPG
jgi:hypothetical protein